MITSKEKIYKYWYLTELNGQWCELIKNAVSNGFALEGIAGQNKFYQNNVKAIENESRVFVILSDALRYEVAAELNEKLLRETNGTAKLSAMQSVFPGITKFGMAALLPHKELGVELNGKSLHYPLLTLHSLYRYSRRNCLMTYCLVLKSGVCGKGHLWRKGNSTFPRSQRRL